MLKSKPFLAVHLILRMNDDLLVLRRKGTGYEDGNYSLVAGHVEDSEDVYGAMIREAYEEANIIIDKSQLTPVHVMQRKENSDEKIDYFFECNSWRGTIVNSEPEKCSDLRWVPIKKLPPNMVGYIHSAIKDYQRKNMFSVLGW